MNISYLVSILDLYLKKETKEKILIIDITKSNNIIKVDFSYSNTHSNKTYVKLESNVFFDNLKYLINKCQKNLDIKNENINNNTYTINFSNNRQINFNNFDDNELSAIRNSFDNLVIDIIGNTSVLNTVSLKDEVKENKEESYNEIYKETKKKKLSFSMGFSSFITIFLTAIWFLDIFMIALWIFKSMK